MNEIILGDIHIGARNDCPVMRESQLDFMENVLFPYITENDIKTIWQLGDLFDRRRYTDHETMHEWITRFFEPLERANVNMITLLGNHDLYYRNRLDLNTSSLLLRSFKNIRIIDKPTDVGDFFVVPWLNHENIDEFAESLVKTEKSICLGHFEINGFPMHNSGHLCNSQITPKFFSKFQDVYSGHFHHSSKIGNISYIGSPYDMSWGESDQKKGFVVMNKDDFSTQFIENPILNHLVIKYNDVIDAVDGIDFSIYQRKIVRVLIDGDFKKLQLDMLINRLYENNVHKVDVIIKSTDNMDDIEITDEEIQTDDTGSISTRFIKEIETELDQDKLSNLFTEIYNRSI